MFFDRSLTRRARLLSHATLALGLWIAPTLSALGLERPCRPAYQCPPGWRHQQQHAAPYYEGATPAQPQTTTPGADPMAPQAMEPGQEPAEQPAEVPQQDFGDAPSSSRASLSPGADTPQLGRLDFANRLNLFDNMTAAPQNKVWFGYQHSSGIDTGTAITPGFIGPLPPAAAVASITGKQRQSNFRVGAEVCLSEECSVAVQGQYYRNLDDESFFDDSWSQPQILLKYVLGCDYDTVLSATFGIQPETGIESGDFEEETTRLYPGMLYYQMLNPTLFTQGGFQFGIPTDDDQGVHTFDWSVSLGYWLYRDCCADCCCHSSWITGVVPQVGVLGKHVIGDGTVLNPYGFGEAFNGVFQGAFTSTESDNVIDLTVGTLIIIDQSIQVGVGYSLPLTDDEVREDEFITYVNYVF